MLTRPARRGVRPALAVLAVAALLLTAACSSGDDAGDGAAVAATTQAAPEPLTPAQLATVVKAQSRALDKAARQFERCEASGIAGYGFNTCWRKALPATVAAADFAETLRAAQAPATHAVVLGRLDRLAGDGKRIRKGCRTGNDQTCDQALMRFRDDVQKVEWELDLL